MMSNQEHSPSSLLALVLLLLPFCAPLVALGVAASRPGPPGGVAGAAEGRVLAHRSSYRVAVFARSQVEVQVFDLDGGALGSLAASPLAAAQTVPFLDGDTVLYLGGRGREPVVEAHVGLLPLDGGTAFTVPYRLPRHVPFELAGDHETLVRADAPLALRCGRDVLLLRTGGGWARLQVKAGRPFRPRRGQRRPPPPEVAPLLQRPAPAGCRPMAHLGHRPPVPAESGILDEVWLDGAPYLLAGSRVPPPYLTLIAPDRSLDRLIEPPRESAPRGAVLRQGRWVLFHGRGCEIGQIDLVLSDLRDSRRRPSLWARTVPMASFAGCRPDLPPPAWICPLRSLVQVEVGEVDAAWSLATGRALAPVSRAERSTCWPMRPMRTEVGSWEAGRTLQSGSEMFRVMPGPPRVEVSRAGQRLFVTPLHSPGYILGATGDSLLVVEPPTNLLVVDRHDGQIRRSLREPALHDAEQDRPAPCTWIGSLGSRAFWLIGGPVVRLAVFDGRRLHLPE